MENEEWAKWFRAAVDAEPTPRRTELARMGDAVRALIEQVAGTNAPTEELSRMADAVSELAASFEGHPKGRLYDGFGESANAGTGRAMFDHSPMIGVANPLAPPIRLDLQTDMVVGDVTFGSAYEGPPGCVHGGYLAAAFDEILGATQSMGGRPGMTGTLTVRYRRPTPLHRRLRFEGELVGVEGRKIFTAGRCLLDGELTAEAEAVFISIDLARFAELYRARQGQRGADTAS
jgi:acyl-coenzyme A thioesterase PaaI-like protein